MDRRTDIALSLPERAAERSCGHQFQIFLICRFKIMFFATMTIRFLLLGASFATAFLQTTPTRTFVSLRSEPNPEDTKLVESVFVQANGQKASNSDEQIPLNDEKRADILLPTTGVSVSETMEEAQRDQYKTDLVPVTTLPGVAQVVTKSTAGSFDPIRYLVALTPPTEKNEDGEVVPTTSTEPQQYVLTDIPPYSDRLAALIRKFMGPSGKLAAICMTSRTGVHYDEAPGVFTTRKSDIADWLSVFPKLEIVGYRLDIPRDCGPLVSQKLNGYGPWAWNNDGVFEETGRPLITKEWDAKAVKTMLQKGLIPPEVEEEQVVDENEYTPESIRQKEEGKRLIAVYTPGHTHGTLSYVFPETNVVVSGFTIPIEDAGADNAGQFSAPVMDARGYITTSGAGMAKQMESARRLVNTYGDRFGIVLPARDDPFFLDELEESERKSVMLRIIDQYDQIGQIYSRLGIFSDDDDESDLDP